MAAKKKATAKKAAATKASPKAPTKSEILNHISGETDLSRKEVQAVLDSLSGIQGHGLSPSDLV